MGNSEELKFKSYCSYLLYRLSVFNINEVYIYGIGMSAQKLINYFDETSICILGLIDDGNGDRYLGDFKIPILRLSEIRDVPKIVIIASEKYQEIIFEQLVQMRMPRTRVIKAFEKACSEMVEQVEFAIDNEKQSNTAIRTVFYIGDNTDTLNFGCRATSQALYDIISKSVYIADKLCRDEILGLFTAISRCDDLLQYASAIKKLNKDVWNELIVRIQKVDAVVLNGEGSFIFQLPPRLDLHNYAVLLLICAEIGKPFFVMNAMFSSYADEPLNVKLMEQCLSILTAARLVIARDLYSVNLITQYNKKIAIQYMPDALFSWYDIYEKNSNDFEQVLKHPEWVLPFFKYNEFDHEIDFSSDFILVSGNSYAARYPRQAERCFIELVSALHNIVKELGLRLYLLESCIGDRMLRNVALQMNVPVIPVETNIYLAGYILGKAACYISGRYHPSILASLGGTPCVFMKSNSHKTISLQAVLEIPVNERVTFSASPDSDEVNKIVSVVEKSVMSEKYMDRRTQIKEACGRNMNKIMKIKDIFS